MPRFRRAGFVLFASALTSVGLRILDRNGSQPPSHAQPLYTVNDISIPDEGTGNRCVSLRMDKTTHAFEVDTKPQDESSVAWACFHDRMEETGWCGLEVSTTEAADVPLSVRAYGAGLLEGLLTQKRMYEFYENAASLYNKDTDGDPSLRASVDRALGMIRGAWTDFAEPQEPATEPTDPLEKQAWVALRQMRGIRDGYNLAADRVGAKLLSTDDMFLMNMHAELPALVELYRRSLQTRVRVATAATRAGSLPTESLPSHPERKPPSVAAPVLADSPVGPRARWGARRPHGSAVARRLGPEQSPEDLLMGHVTVGDYGEMTRIFKHYTLHSGAHVGKIAMSSYPGCVGSTDDYIMNDKGFVAMSTSLFVPGEGEFSVPPKTISGLPSFVRSLIAIRIATSPLMWERIYGFFHGIAGGKQWLLADYSKMQVQQPLSANTVWLVESLPGLQRSRDVSETLRRDGFFEVHAEPLLPKIRQAFGLPILEEEQFSAGSDNSLLQEEAKSVQSIENARQLLGSAQTVPAGKTPISSRLDLDPQEPVPFGGIDAKVTSKCLVHKLGSQIHSGPPRMPGGDGFNWQAMQDSFPDWPREGLPETYKFGWVDALPGALENSVDESNAECSDDEDTS